MQGAFRVVIQQTTKQRPQPIRGHRRRQRQESSPLDNGLQFADRARTLLPGDFCGPTRFVSGCDVLPEYANESWRIYFHQYQLREGQREWGGLTHTYVVLDPVGNCYANIPGTEPGAPR